MLPSTQIKDWKHIFLDTSFIIDYLSDPNRPAKDALLQERRELVHKVMAVFQRYGTSDHKKRCFYISSLTLTELTRLKKEDTAKELVKIFSASDVNFVAYTKQTALELNQRIAACLSEGQVHQLRAYLEKEAKALGIANVRQWVTTDMMIAASAMTVRGLDVILTSDKNTFKVVADALELPCMAMFKTDVPMDIFGDIAVSIK